MTHGVQKLIKSKTVKFEEEEKARREESLMEDLGDDRRQRISQEEAQPIFDLLQKDLVKAKMEDMNVLTKIYHSATATSQDAGCFVDYDALSVGFRGCCE